jgi:hypothetical protein
MEYGISHPLSYPFKFQIKIVKDGSRHNSLHGFFYDGHNVYGAVIGRSRLSSLLWVEAMTFILLLDNYPAKVKRYR